MKDLMEFFRLLMLSNAKNFRAFVNVILVLGFGWVSHLYIESVNEKLREKDVIIEYFKLRVETTDKEYKQLMETRIEDYKKQSKRK
jgi:hypothetical protein